MEGRPPRLLPEEISRGPRAQRPSEIALGAVVSKAVHKLRRTRCAHYLTPWVRDTQRGGFGG
eukprot:15035899-Alexandrium_andersonii.AAC.1